MTKHVAICVPSHDTWSACTATSIVDMVRFSMANHVDCGVINWRGAMITAARNGLVNQALAIRGVDAIMWVDHDIVMPPDAILRLLDHDRDIVGCFYNRRVPPYDTVGKLADPNADISKGGLHKAEFLPGGFVMVKTDVYRELASPWYFESYRWPGSAIASFVNRLRDEAVIKPAEEEIANLQAAPHFVAWVEANHAAEVALSATPMFSEDSNFSRKARNYGFDLWVDMSLTYQLSHMGHLPVQCLAPKAE